MGDAYAMLQAALEYARRGFQVFPLIPRGKIPLTQHGHKDATVDEAIIQSWWGKWPDANIGIRCDGLLVTDFDGYIGAESRNRLIADNGELPITLAVKTGGGTKAKPKEQGLHIIYKAPNGLNIRPGAGKYGYSNMDVRANDSYIVAPPSFTRLRYEIIEDAPIANAPDWLIKIVMAGSNGNKPQPRPLTELKDGQRHVDLISFIGKWRIRGFTEDEIIIQALALNHYSNAPLSEAEVIRMCEQYAKEPAKADGPGWVTLADVAPETVRWLWRPYIPIGKLTLLEGDPGIGKSWCSLAIATAVSQGTMLPGQNETPSGPVLIASAEDGLGDTIRPRLEKMGADLNGIYAIKDLMTLDQAGFDMLENYISDTVPGLLIIDPLVAYFSGDMDINRANAVRWGTSRLARLAEKYGMSLLAVRHLTKGGSLKPIYRGLGSIDFTASARSVLLVGCDPDNESIRGIVHIKSNLAKMGEAVGYELREDGFYWTDHSDLTSERILAGKDEGESQLETANRFLKEYLTDGPATWEDIKGEGEAYGLSEHTLRRARGIMKLENSKQGELGKRGGGKWLWMLPGKGD